MTFTQMMAFAAFAKNRNITKAAQALRVSQPSVSKHLKNLEELYGVKLFERIGGMAELTEEGRICLRRINGILFHLDKLQYELGPKKSSKPEILKVAGSYDASAKVLPSVISRFQKKHKDTRIVLRTGSRKMIRALMLRSEVEIAVLNENPSNPNLESEKFREEEFIVFAAPTHPLSRKGNLVLPDLNRVVVVATGGKGRLSTTDKILRASENHGEKVRIGIRCGTPEAVKAIVQKGTGIGILSADTVIPEIRRKIFKPLKFSGVKLVVQTYIVYCKDRPLSPLAREFLAMLRGESSREIVDAPMKSLRKA